MKAIHKIGLIAAAVVFVILIFTMWTDVDPGEEGFMYYPYSDGVDTSRVYSEGSTTIAPWNEMITYNIRQQNRKYSCSVNDYNTTPVTVIMSINYHVIRGKSAQLHLLHGKTYAETFIDPKVEGAIKEVIGRYEFAQLFSTKRDAVEQEIESILNHEFAGNFVALDFIEIQDMNLPGPIEEEIVSKEKQRQANENAELKEEQAKFDANARFQTARGDSALLISATYKAQAIERESKALKNNPEYTELIKWQRWDGHGSPYGSGNVFGSGINILKGMN